MAQAGAYYNEIDPYAADWLRNLIAAGHIAPGDVDERSIEDVHPDDLRPYTQCHFFAGIGVWSYALRRAGWPDDRPVWTGSCPCQPFSEAGKGAGFDDERHLWPAWHWLIQECRPPAVFGEQVAKKDAEPWLDLVSADLEALGFAVGALAFPSAGVGAPHIRERTYFLAHTSSAGLEKRLRHRGEQGIAGRGRDADARGSTSCRVADSQQHDCGCEAAAADNDRPQADRPADRAGRRCGPSGGLADAGGLGRQRRQGVSARRDHGGSDAGRVEGDHGLIGVGEARDGSQPAGPVNGFWRAADWLLCRDGKWRPVEPGTSPLAHGAPARVGRLRAYGNAINAQQAQIFIEESMRCI
ncbi:DNA cytosine methyltransferase [Achromobacter denitrificans]|uniref:DNA cytosine methyltransferase n=1 Tax=Achromobacter denitrificans TaxID=32002 RepID=A0ABZ3GA83_ACHDE